MRKHQKVFLTLLIALLATLPLLAVVEGQPDAGPDAKQAGPVATLPLLAVVQSQTPGLPHSFWGDIALSVQGALVPAPVGTEVIAQVDGVERGRISVAEAGKYGNPQDPKLLVQGNIADGATIRFLVRLPNGGDLLEADQAFPFTEGAVTRLDLTVGQSPPQSLPGVAFASASSNGAESVTPVNLQVVLSSQLEQTVAVQYRATGGTATGGGVDYTLLGSGALSLAPGVTSGSISISVVNDALVEGNETIVVELSSPTNATLGAIAAHTYTIRDNDAAITLAPALASNPVNTAHTVTATVTGTGAQPLQGILVDFEIKSGPNAGAATGSGTTDSQGRATFTYVGAAGPGDDRIEACVNDASLDSACNQATKRWVTLSPAPQAISLAPASATNLAGTTHRVTATVTGAGGQPRQGVQVRFKVISGPNEGQVSNPGAGECSARNDCATDASGRVSWTYTSDDRPGTDGIVACFAEAGRQFCSRFSQVAVKEWVLPTQPEPVNILLSPLTATNAVGTAHTVTATVTGNGNGGQPVQGVRVDFAVTSGPSAGVTGSGATDVAGKARFTYTGASVGRDIIVARFVDSAGDTRTSNQVSKDWTAAPGPQPAPMEIALGPLTDANRVGTAHTVTATVTGNDNGDQAVQGVLVSFAVLSGPNSGEVSNPNTGECTARNNCTTDASGRVSWTYTGAGGAGTDTIVARFVDQAGNTRSSNTAQKTWVVSNQSPNCADAFPSRESLSPPNRRFVRIEVLGVTDPDGDPVTITIDSIWQDEPVTGPGNTAPDGRGVGTSTAGVRAERDGSGNGRVYHIRFTATDGQGGSCSGEVLVGVPHDRGNGTTPVDDGALHDSTLGRAAGSNSIGPNSCRGEDSCRGRNLIIGANSCNGEEACNGNGNTIGDNSCNEEEACKGNRNTIGNRSCNGEEACKGNNNSIGNRSCNEEEACRGSGMTIGDDRCNEEEACRRGKDDDDDDDDDDDGDDDDGDDDDDNGDDDDDDD